MSREGMTICMRDGCTYQQMHEINDYIDNLEQENGALKGQLQTAVNNCKLRDEVINEIYDYIQNIINDPVKYATKNNVEAIFNIVRRYKGDKK